MIRVTCAIIRNEENEILIVQRGANSEHPNKWEFPGGKVQEGESEEECIVREINEELSMEIIICGRLTEVGYDYGTKQIQLIPFVCDTLEELPLLTEHIAFRWLAPEDLGGVDFSEADILVADEYLQSVIEVTVKKDANSLEEQKTDENELKRMVNQMMGLKEAEWIAVSAVENPAIFRKLVEYSFLPDRRLAFRASWTLSKACDRFPEMIVPYLDDIIERLSTVDNESALRSFLRIISLSDFGNLPARYQGILADFSFKALNSGDSAIAVKAYSMEILYKLAKIYPELAYELSATINMLKGEGSAGIIARGHIILKKLASEPKGRGSSQT